MDDLDDAGTQDRDAFTVADASDPAEAEAVVGSLYLPNRLELSRGEARVDMELAAVTLGSLTIGRLRYGKNVRLTTGDADHFHVNAPLAGRSASACGRMEPVVIEPGWAAVFRPGEVAQIEWTADCVQMCLMVPRATLESELEQLLGRSVTHPLRFDFAMDLTTPIGRSWHDWLRQIDCELGRPPGLLAHPFAGRHLERLLLDGLLLGQPHNYREALVAPARSAPRGPIAQAVELLQGRPGDPWSSTALAREVHLSVRSLQEGFKRQVGKPPMAYLREVRLRRANEELRAALPGTTTVEAVAMRWGFVHLGRFAAAYRATFREVPSRTLGRWGPAS